MKEPVCCDRECSACMIGHRDTGREGSTDLTRVMAHYQRPLFHKLAIHVDLPCLAMGGIEEIRLLTLSKAFSLHGVLALSAAHPPLIVRGVVKPRVIARIVKEGTTVLHVSCGHVLADDSMCFRSFCPRDEHWGCLPPTGDTTHTHTMKVSERVSEYERAGVL